LQVLNDKKNWVAWTPEGFYGATPGAFGVLRWHVNRGDDAAGDAVPVSAIPRLKRPDALPLVLQELETARALGIARIDKAKRMNSDKNGAYGPGIDWGHLKKAFLPHFWGLRTGVLRVRLKLREADQQLSTAVAVE
jgi:hypothetical protein